VKLTVSKGIIKWTPHSAVMFKDTIGWFPFIVNEKSFGTIQNWYMKQIMEASDGLWIKKTWTWLRYLNFYNQDAYEKEVHIEITKV